MKFSQKIERTFNMLNYDFYNDNKLDIVIANQVFENFKEMFKNFRFDECCLDEIDLNENSQNILQEICLSWLELVDILKEFKVDLKILVGYKYSLSNILYKNLSKKFLVNNKNLKEKLEKFVRKELNLYLISFEDFFILKMSEEDEKIQEKFYSFVFYFLTKYSKGDVKKVIDNLVEKHLFPEP